MTDKTLTCRDCRQGFQFSALEQAFFTTQGLHRPRRCKGCRQFRRAQRQADADETAARTTFNQQEKP